MDAQSRGQADGVQGSESRPDLAALRTRLTEFMDRNGGRLYAPIDHPDLSDLPAWYGHERFSVIEKWIHPSFVTALDIGTNLGAFAHWLEDKGLQVAAVEREPFNAQLAAEVRDFCGRKFEILAKPLGDVGPVTVDFVLALSVFHHSLKTEAGFSELESSLQNIRCKACVLQGHGVGEPQMEGAFKGWSAEELSVHVAELLGHPFRLEIGSVAGRKLYFSSRDRLSMAPTSVHGWMTSRPGSHNVER